jgi:hypothetical protein
MLSKKFKVLVVKPAPIPPPITPPITLPSSPAIYSPTLLPAHPDPNNIAVEIGLAIPNPAVAPATIG